jgi:hypothetical protein
MIKNVGRTSELSTRSHFVISAPGLDRFNAGKYDDNKTLRHINTDYYTHPKISWEISM